jgi:hypothetical protein
VTPEPDPPLITSYRDAAGAMRDTTKWLVAFVPGASVFIALAQLIPRLGQRDSTDHRWWWAAGLLAVSAVVAAVAIGFAARVLTVGVPGWGTAVRMTAEAKRDPIGQPVAGTLASDLDRDGVVRPYVAGSAADLFWRMQEETRTRADQAAVIAVVDYAAFHDTRARFRCFLWVGAACAAISLTAIAKASLLVETMPKRPDSEPLTKPLTVAVHLAGAKATQKYTSLLGCAPTMPFDAWLVGGTLEHPLLVIPPTTTGCRVAEVHFEDGDGIVVPR